MLYAVPTHETAPSRFGFVVSKAVGNAVTRNLVKRRLREVAAGTLRTYPTGLFVVVRALPAAAAAGWNELYSDYGRALATVLTKIGRQESCPERSDRKVPGHTVPAQPGPGKSAPCRPGAGTESEKGEIA